jgi:hypothetical protein
MDADGRRVAVAREVTSSLRAIAPGRAVEGIVTFPPQATADGLTLRVTMRGPGGARTFDFELEGLIHPVAVVTASPSPSP